MTVTKASDSLVLLQRSRIVLANYIYRSILGLDNLMASSRLYSIYRVKFRKMNQEIEIKHLEVSAA
jgi:hypothetical protein